MQIVIDIPDRIYKISQNRTLNIVDDEILEKAIKNGTPLPKGHGNLKDIDKIEQILDVETPDNIIAKALKNLLESVPTIIEADKEDKNNGR